MGKTNPVFGRGLDVRREDLFIALATKFTVSQIVGDEKHGVRFFGAGSINLSPNAWEERECQKWKEMLFEIHFIDTLDLG